MHITDIRAIAAVLLAASVVQAQERAESERSVPGWSVLPSFDTAAVYDDNLRFLPGEPEGIIFTRLTAAFDTNFVGTTNSFAAGYSASTEIFPERFEEFTTIPSRQRASLSYTSQLNPRTGLQIDGSYLLSYNPTEVVDSTGIEFGRRRSQGYSANLGFNRSLTERHGLSIGFAANYRQLDGGDIDDTRRTNVGQTLFATWSHNYSVRSFGALSYGIYVYTDLEESIFPGLSSSLKSHVLTYSWSYQLSPRSAIGLNAGPRAVEEPTFSVVGDEIEAGIVWRYIPEARVSFDYRWERTSFSVAYARTQNQSFGGAGRVDTQSLVLSVTMEPASQISITVSPGAFRNEQLGQTADTYRAALGVDWQVAGWLSLDAEYRYSYQELLLGLAGGAGGTLEPRSRNVASISLVLEKVVPLD